MYLLPVMIPPSCLPAPPDDQPNPSTSMLVRWTVNGRTADEWFCRGLSTGTVKMEIWENADFEIHEGYAVCPETAGADFYIASFECDEGICRNEEQMGERCKEDSECCESSAEECRCPDCCTKGMVKTPSFFFSDVPTCIKIVLVSHLRSGEEEDDILGETGSYRLITPDEDSTCVIGEEQTINACFDFASETGIGTANFVLDEFAPLDVEIEWAVHESAPTAYGGCEDSVPDVRYMGYKLITSDDEILDREEVDRKVIDCRGEINWALVPYDTYALEIEGRDENRELLWKGTCENLMVDGSPRQHLCRVPVEEL